LHNLVVIFDERVYSVVTLQKAAYRFINYFACNFSLSEHQIQCEIESTGNMTPEAFNAKVHDFKKEVLDQHLREKIKAETDDIRNLILSVAFSSTGLQKVE